VTAGDTAVTPVCDSSHPASTSDKDVAMETSSDVTEDSEKQVGDVYKLCDIYPCKMVLKRVGVTDFLLTGNLM